MNIFVNLASVATCCFIASHPLLPPTNDPCSVGCNMDDGSGGAIDEQWTFVPDYTVTQNGTCFQNCSWTACAFKGTLTYKNNSNGPRTVFDDTGTDKGTYNPGQTNTWNVLFSAVGCGDADFPKWKAKSNGTETSNYAFECSPCSQIGEI